VLGLGQKRRTDSRPKSPVLDISGPKLRAAFEHLVKSAEATGGVERYVSALALKSSLFAQILGPNREKKKGQAGEIGKAEFFDLAAFIAPVRRRMGGKMSGSGGQLLLMAVGELLSGAPDVATADQRMARFMAAFPTDKSHRWVRDLGAELLHYSAPETYPLMTRWVWDAKVGTGVLREIWFDENDGVPVIEVDDNCATFVTLAEELRGFLAQNGVFKDQVFYADLLCAHVYAGYINHQGGQYLRSDFSDDADPMHYTRRMLGLDAIDTQTGRTRLKLIDGAAHRPGRGSLALN